MAHVIEAARSAEAATPLPACPVCAGTDWAPPLRHTCLRACRRCGTFLNDRSRTRQEEESRYTRGGSPALAGEDAVARAQWRWLMRTLRPARESLAILDVGCGSGAFLRAAQEAGARVMGLELAPAMVEECRSAGIPVIQGSLFDTGVPPGSWDVITLWDVLDHLEDPALALRLLAAEVTAGGSIVVRGRNARLHVPLKAAYMAAHGFAGRIGFPDLSAVHRWGFSPSGYRALLERAGLQAIRLHPGVPTPGDRYGALGPGLAAAVLKGFTRAGGLTLHAATRGRVYPFASVLITGSS